MAWWGSKKSVNTGEAPPIRVRRAQPEDGEAVAAMARALSRSDGGRAGAFSAERFRADGFGPDRAFETLVAEVGKAGAEVEKAGAEDTLAGYAVFYPGYDTDSATRGIYLADLYVREDFRRRGVGHALMRGLASYGRGQGARWMFWSVLKRNRGARRFYRSLAPELGDVTLCAAFGSRFERLADDGEAVIRRPD
jgi:ribosomal protein S18 acetylase RimI-like enzyme